MSRSTSRPQGDARDRDEAKRRSWSWWLVAGGIVVLAVTLAVVNLTRVSDPGTTYLPVRADAAAALTALSRGDLGALEKQLASHRGRADFAYYFTAQTTPRLLGDALASVAGDHNDLDPGIDPDQYDLTLTDLAGTVALATHGTARRALPPSWTTDFITATTEPLTLYPHDPETTNDATDRRADQDIANKQNLLLLLSRGYWSTDFLKAVTSAYWEFDHANDDDGWFEATLPDAKYAPTPDGVHLSDGVLALTAALTANAAASKWAFTEFRPGTQNVTYGDSEHPIGNFTHYLFFEHQYRAGSDGGSDEDSGEASVGMTATLTALSSAIDVDPIPIGPPTSPEPSTETSTPRSDALVLQAMAKSLHENDGCSWDPRDYGHCAVAAAEAVWHFAQHWGHLVLDILSLAAYAPPPWRQIGMSAAAVNATWYAIEGDYTKAGLSLAVVVPSLSFTRISATVKGGIEAEEGAEAALQVEKVAKRSAFLAKIAQAWRSQPWRDCSAVPLGGLRLHLSPTWTRQQKQAAIAKVQAYYEAAQQGLLRKTVAQREGSASARYLQAGGTLRDGQDVDHTIDLQLGGRDDLSNMRPLDASVNRSLGIQVAAQLRNLAVGTVITAAAIC